MKERILKIYEEKYNMLVKARLEKERNEQMVKKQKEEEMVRQQQQQKRVLEEKEKK